MSKGLVAGLAMMVTGVMVAKGAMDKGDERGRTLAIVLALWFGGVAIIVLTGYV